MILPDTAAPQEIPRRSPAYDENVAGAQRDAAAPVAGALYLQPLSETTKMKLEAVLTRSASCPPSPASYRN